MQCGGSEGAPALHRCAGSAMSGPDGGSGEGQHVRDVSGARRRCGRHVTGVKSAAVGPVRAGPVRAGPGAVPTWCLDVSIGSAAERVALSGSFLFPAGWPPEHFPKGVVRCILRNGRRARGDRDARGAGRDSDLQTWPPVPAARFPACSTGWTPRQMTVMKKRAPKVSPFAQMLRDKREKLAPDVPLRDFCASRGFDALMISDMEADRRTAPGTYPLLYKLASGYGHQPNDRWTRQLLEAALGIAPPQPKRSSASSASRARSDGGASVSGRVRATKQGARGAPASRSRSSRTAGSRSRG